MKSRRCFTVELFLRGSNRASFTWKFLVRRDKGNSPVANIKHFDIRLGQRRSTRIFHNLHDSGSSTESIIPRMPLYCRGVYCYDFFSIFIKEWTLLKLKSNNAHLIFITSQKPAVLHKRRIYWRTCVSQLFIRNEPARVYRRKAE